MTKTCLIVLLSLTINSISFAQGLTSKNDTFKVVLNGTYSFSDCGIVMHKYHLKFTILNTTYSFIGIITCPEVYGKHSFIEGTKFLIGTSKLSSADSIYYSQQLKINGKKNKLPVYSIISVQKLK